MQGFLFQYLTSLLWRSIITQSFLGIQFLPFSIPLINQPPVIHLPIVSVSEPMDASVTRTHTRTPVQSITILPVASLPGVCVAPTIPTKHKLTHELLVGVYLDMLLPSCPLSLELPVLP